MPELLTQPKTPESPSQVAGIKSEWWPASNRNGGRHQIGIPGRLPSESTPIWAGGHVAVYVGRTHDRFRTAIKSCKLLLELNGPSTHERCHLSMRLYYAFQSTELTVADG